MKSNHRKWVQNQAHRIVQSVSNKAEAHEAQELVSRWLKQDDVILPDWFDEDTEDHLVEQVETLLG